MVGFDSARKAVTAEQRTEPHDTPMDLIVKKRP
jgi:hypothetical protein